jgi:hypothetical protein
VLLERDVALAKGDTIQLGFHVDSRYAMILSLDGRNVVTVHYPEGAPCSTEIPGQHDLILLSHAFELDDAPRFEHFFLVVSETPIDIGKTTAWFQTTPYEKLFSSPLPDGETIGDDFRLRKAPRGSTARPPRTSPALIAALSQLATDILADQPGAEEQRERSCDTTTDRVEDLEHRSFRDAVHQDESNPEA